jgi:hypothetical protein
MKTPDSISDLIAALTRNPDIIAMLEYGSARFSDSAIDGDYDLLVITISEHPQVESLHFRCGGIPVDLNIRAIGSLRDDSEKTEFEISMYQGRVIHDRDGQIQPILRELTAKRRRNELSSEQIAHVRHGTQHILDKTRNRLESDRVMCRYLLHQGMYWLVREYFEVRGQDFPGDKLAFGFFADNESTLYSRLERFYEEQSLSEQRKLYGEVAIQVLAPVGGPWAKDELLVFGDHESGRVLFEGLFGSD